MVTQAVETNPNETAQQGEKKKIINGYFSVELVSVNPNWGVQAVMLIDDERMMTGMEKSMKGLPKQLLSGHEILVIDE